MKLTASNSMLDRTTSTEPVDGCKAQLKNGPVLTVSQTTATLITHMRQSRTEPPRYKDQDTTHYG